MVVPVIIVILGALLIAAAVLLRPKLPTALANGVLIVAICLALIGAILLYFALAQAREDACNIYMALRYLEQDQGDASWYYLRRTPSDSFDSIAASVVMENARGNREAAKDKLDELEERAHLGQKDTVKQLEAYLDGEQTLQDTATYLLEHIDLNKGLQQEMDKRFTIETGIPVGNVTLEELGDTLTLEQQVNTALTQKKYREAVEKAVALVDHSASANNRLLLAECVAEALYAGDYLDGAVFDPDVSAETIANGTAAKERAELKKDIDTLSEQVNTAWDEKEKLTDDAAKQRAQGKLDVLLEQLREAQNASNFLFGRRALTSIANIHSPEADVVRARLYFAMQEKSKAMEILQETADSLGVALSFDSARKEQFQALKDAYEDKDPEDVREQEFQDLMRTLLSPGALDTVGVIAGPITGDMVQYIVRDAVSSK